MRIEVAPTTSEVTTVIYSEHSHNGKVKRDMLPGQPGS
jgi:hypothetical protein